MITKQEFDFAAKSVLTNFTAIFPKMISYKSFIQSQVLGIATCQELEDVRDCRINQGLIDKLCKLTNRQWETVGDATSLYCAAMAVATIIKEFDWGTQYLAADGLWTIAQRIQNS